MSFFGSKLFGLSGNGVAGAPGATPSSFSSSISGAETIERLCDRVQSSLLIEDRHESLRSIKSLSKKYKLEVGTQAMPVLIDVLKNNKMDSDLCCLVLDTLSIIMNTNPDESEKQMQNLPADISNQFTEMFIKDNSNVTLLFDLLDEFDFQTRWSTVKLLNQIILNQLHATQDIILQIPRGVSRLMDLLNDSREIIRNDAILLLYHLTKTNANIQKIIAFESGFDRIMEIIEGEGSVLDGGVVVEDCFNVLLNLLQTNYSNQSFFKEANYIKKICKYLDLNSSTMSGGGSNGSLNGLDANGPDLSDNSTSWTMQKTANLSLLLKLIRCLVAPNNSQQIVIDCQKAFSHFGLLHRMCALLTLAGVPADLLSESITTVGEVIRGNNANQQLFSTVMMPTIPQRPIITVLLMAMINEKQPFHLRCSILYCFQCFLYKNEEKKSETIETLLPREQPQIHNQITTGQILCSGIFSPNDFVSNWLCAIALAHTINDSNVLKEGLLRVTLSINAQTVSLLQQCMNVLIESSAMANYGGSGAVSSQVNNIKLQTVVSILMLISTWLSSCPNAVNIFLSHQQNIPYLISQASSTDTEDRSLIIQGISCFLLGLNMLYNTNKVPTYTVDNLKDIIKKRIGIEQFEHKLEFITQHEAYSRTLKLPTFAFKSIKPVDLLFDYEFTRLFKSNETLIVNLLTNKNQNLPSLVIPNSESGMNLNNKQMKLDEINNQQLKQQLEQQAEIMTQYQQIIREQDAKLREQHQVNQGLSQTCAQWQERCGQLESMSQMCTVSPTTRENELSEKLRAQARISELEMKVNQLEEKCSEQEDELAKLKRNKGIFEETMQSNSNSDLVSLNRQIKDLNEEQENLLVLLTEMEVKLKKYKRIAKQSGYQVSDNEDEAYGDDEGENNSSNIEKQIDKVRLSLVATSIDSQHQYAVNNTHTTNFQFTLPPPPSKPSFTPLNNNQIIDEPPKPQIAQAHFDSTSSNKQHQHQHHYIEQDNDSNQFSDGILKLNNDFGNISGNNSHENSEVNYPIELSNVANPLETYGIANDREQSQGYSRNNIFQMIASNPHSNSSDNSSLASDRYQINNSSSSSGEGSNLNQLSPGAPRPLAETLHHKPQSFSVNTSQTVSSEQQQTQPEQFNFFQYFNNPQQTEQFQSQINQGGMAAQNTFNQSNNPLQNYFK